MTLNTSLLLTSTGDVIMHLQLLLMYCTYCSRLGIITTAPFELLDIDSYHAHMGAGFLPGGGDIFSEFRGGREGKFPFFRTFCRGGRVNTA